MNIGIDASNIISGGGLTHLVELLKAVDLKAHKIDSIEVWAPEKTLLSLSLQEGVKSKTHALLEGSALKKAYWQRSFLTSYASDHYDVLYVPGGSYTGTFHPVVTMNRNLLPFDSRERARYGWSRSLMRMIILEKVQAYTYKRASGVIFLSEAAKRITQQQTGRTYSHAPVIPHGISRRFFQAPREQKGIDDFSFENPFRFFYASTITVYKHQWKVIEAISKLRTQGYPVELQLAGSTTTEIGKERFEDARMQFDPDDDFVHYHGKMSQTALVDGYHRADGFVFASSCETFGQILMESMASGLPIASSDRSAMPEVLGDAGLYFDPENPDSIAGALKKMLDSSSLRREMADKAYARAQTYSWEKCADATFSFIHDIFKAKVKQ
jgi:glycosyltransferase involved in cell wall biosynthesis